MAMQDTIDTTSYSRSERTLRGLLDAAGIEVNGGNPWDIQVHHPGLWSRVMRQGDLGLGEAYMEKWWDCADLCGFISRLLEADIRSHLRPTPNLIKLAIKSYLFNRQAGSRAFEAAEAHYDMPAEIFELTFDKRLKGSCGYWSGTPAATDLDSSAEAGLDLVARKIGLMPGHTMYDIGCGWGAMMGYAAQKYGAHCTGVTVSKAQVEEIGRRYPGLPITPHLTSYTDFNGGPFDRVVSMGMFEHVGEDNYPTYFEHARSQLKDDGIFLLHTILGTQRSRMIYPWMDKYIFPNGQLPTVGQITDLVEKLGLFVVEDFHNFGHDYYHTLMAWAKKAESNRARIIEIADEFRQFDLDGEQFYRMWLFYYYFCAAGFKTRTISVGQFVLSPKGVKGGYARVR